MKFSTLLMATALLIAGCAEFFSVYGLAKIFAGAFWAIIAMGSAIGVGKLVSTSFLYRFWHKIAWPLKIYLTTAILGLMLITSLGVFGFLESANNSTLLPYEQTQENVVTLQSHIADIKQLKDERLQREQQINKQIAELPSNTINGRKRLIAANSDELKQLDLDVAAYTKDILNTQKQIADAKSKVLTTEGDVGPIVYIAKAFNTNTTIATKYLIFMIIFVFDPLAVIMTIAANVASVEEKKQKLINPPVSVPSPELSKNVALGVNVPVVSTNIEPDFKKWTKSGNLMVFPTQQTANPINYTVIADVPNPTPTPPVQSPLPEISTTIVEPSQTNNPVEVVEDDRPKPITELTPEEIKAELAAIPDNPTRSQLAYKKALDRILYRS